MSPEPSGPARARPVSYALIGLVSLASHGFLLTNDGTIWDSWYLLNFLETSNWATLHDFFGAVGIPFYGWLYRPFAWLPDIVAGFMWATVACLLASAILTYELAAKLGALSRGESLVVALLAAGMPLFSAAQDFAMFFFVFTHALFLTAALLAARMLEAQGWRRAALRAAAVLAFYASFTNSALLVYYGGFWLLLLFRYREQEQARALPAIRNFVSRYPEFLLLPPATWIARPFLSPQYGWYEYYNSPIENLPALWPNFQSFFLNVLPHHVLQTAAWPVAHPFATAALAAVAVLVARTAPEAWWVRRGSLSTAHLLWFGALALALAVFPFAAAGKWFAPRAAGESSRFAILTPLPLAILCLAMLRVSLLRAGQSRWLLPLAACLALVLASQLAPVYVKERAQWIYSRALMQSAIRNEAVRGSSVIVLRGYSVVQQDAYAVFGFGSAFGDVSRLVTARAPANQTYFTPKEIESVLLQTTFLPGNFRRIDPAGRQILLEVERVRGAASDREIVSGYLRRRYFGSGAELDAYLASLVSLESSLLRPATALVLATRPAPAEAPRFVKMPAGWWASKFETTQAEFQRLTGSNPSFFVDPARPVDSVSWQEAAAYCDRLTDLEAEAGRLPPGNVYRLPTSEEFELMAAGSTFDEAVTSEPVTRWHTEPVGTLPPNPRGLHDILGNVWEWSLDWGDRDGRLRTSNGGSWVDQVADLSHRAGPGELRDPMIGRVLGPVRRDPPGQGFWNRGFRCVLAPPALEVASPARS